MALSLAQRIERAARRTRYGRGTGARTQQLVAQGREMGLVDDEAVRPRQQGPAMTQPGAGGPGFVDPRMTQPTQPTPPGVAMQTAAPIQTTDFGPQRAQQRQANLQRAIIRAFDKQQAGGGALTEATLARLREAGIEDPTKITADQRGAAGLALEQLPKETSAYFGRGPGKRKGRASGRPTYRPV